MLIKKSFKTPYIAAFFIIIVLNFELVAKTIIVGKDSSANFTSVQSAINSAQNDDIIVVNDGEYSEEIVIKGKNIILTSANGPKNCILKDSDTDGSTIWFDPDENFPPSNAVIQGFTIIADLSDENKGGGIAIEKGSPTISNCIIKGEGTQNGDQGGGIYINGASPKIIACFIEDCQVDDGQDIGEYNGGAAIYIENTIAKTQIINCVIRNNRIWFYDTGSNEEGGIIYIHPDGNSNVEISNCTIVNNSINSGGRSIIQCDNGSTNIINSIVWDNFGQSSSLDGVASATYSCIEGGYNGEANINSDPLLTIDGYHLQSNSPCIDNGTIAPSITTDIDQDLRPYSFLNNLYDIGADEFTFCHEPTFTLNVGTNRSDDLPDSSGINFYEIDLNSQSGYLKIYTTGSADTIGYLIDEDTCGSGSWIKQDDNSGDDNNFYLEYPYAQPGKKLYVAVKKKGDTPQSYNIYAVLETDNQGNTCEVAVNTDKDFKDTYFNTLEILNIPQTGSASIDFIGDEDTYKFSASTPGTIVVMSQTPGITAILKDSDCNETAFHQSSANNNFILKYENYNTDTKTFYIHLFSQNNTIVSNYDIDIYYFPHDKRVDTFYKAIPQENWSGVAIGGAGSSTIDPDNGTYEITAKGADIWEENDEFYFLNKSVTGDYEITIKLESLTPVNQSAKAGLMLRNSLSSDSRHIFSFMAASGSYNLHKRDLDGDITKEGSNQVTAITIPQYLKLKKEDNNFTGFYSSNGIDWTQASQAISLSNPLKKSFYAGIAVTSSQDQEYCTALFKDVEIDSSDININDSQVETGHITTPGDIDFYEINNKKYGTLTIETLNSGKQTYISIFDHSGADITDRTGETFSVNNYSISQELGQGTFYIAVKSFNEQDFGFQYEIKANRQDLNDDHGNSFQTATWLKKWLGSSPLTYFDYETTTPESINDPDLFRLEVKYQGYLTIMAEKIDSDLTNIIYAELFNSSGTSIKQPSDIRITSSPASPPENAYEVYIEPGTYYIKLTGGNIGLTYRLAVDFDDFGDSGANNPKPFTEFEYPIIKGRIETTAQDQLSGEDADAFEIKVPADNMQIKVYTTGDSDTYGVLKDYSGLGLNFNGGPGFNSNYDSKGNFMYIYPPENSDPSAYPPLLAGNSYYIEVAMEDWHDIGEYNLHIELIDTEADKCSLADQILPGEPAVYSSNNLPVENKVLSGLADVDMFKFVADKTGIAKIWSTGNTDTRGELKNSECAVIAFNDDDGSYNNNKNFNLIHPVFEGQTYFIAVKHYRIYETGVYSLNLEITNDASLLEDEGNSKANAFEIGDVLPSQIKTSTQHKLNYSNDIDCFMITAPDGGILEIFTTGDEDTFALLETSDGEVLGFDDDTGADYNSLIKTPIPSSGNYYLIIKSPNASQSGEFYDVNIKFTNNEDSYPGNITKADEAPSISFNTDIDEKIDYNGDSDFYKIIISQSGEYTLRTIGDIDTHAILYNESKDIVAISDNGLTGDGENFRIVKDLVNQTYYLEIFANKNEETGEYTLRVEK